MNRYLAPILFFASTAAFAQSGCVVHATNDTTICGTTLQLNATPGFGSYSWSPATGLSNPNIANPVATISGPVSYTVTAGGSGTGMNMLTNGDFSMGNTGFSSGHNYTTFYNPGNYYVGSAWFGSMYTYITDHTPTTDNMYMSVDGAASSTTVLWEATITGLSPSTIYDFSFWGSRGDVVQPNYEIHFIGNVSGDNIMATIPGIPYTGTFTWDQYGYTGWNSGSDNTVIVRIFNLSTAGYGNDFGLDDFDFHTLCTASDTVNVTQVLIDPPVVSDVNYCLYDLASPLSATGSGLSWSATPAGPGSSVPPVPGTDAAGTTSYYVTQSAGGCTSSPAVINVNVAAPPVFELGQDLVKCSESVVTLGPDDNTWIYTWNDGSTVSPRTLMAEGNYGLSASNQCGTFYDSIRVTNEECDCFLYLPNAFTPNVDGMNDTYKAVYDCELSSFHMDIFDRWGELIFTSDDPEKGWDGNYKNQRVQMEVYVVKVKYSTNASVYGHSTRKSILQTVSVIR